MDRRCTLALVFVLLLLTAVAAVPLAGADVARAAVNTAPPATPVKLVFVHHSTGEAWLADDHGGLGQALRDNNYFVSDTNYGWGPGGIGDRTDIGDWWSWFRDPATAPAATAALYAESARHCTYSRLSTDPGGSNQVVVIKSCFPNSQLSGPSSPVPAIGANPIKGRPAGDAAYTVANAKGIYIDLLGYFGDHPEKLFVVVAAPPVASPDTPGGRALADWLVDHWLQDAAYATGNVAVFDFYTVLSSKTGSGASDAGLATGNHHRIWNGAVQHKTDDGADRLAYPSGGDSHPNAAGDQKATAEFVPLLNNAYNAWKARGGRPVIAVTAPAGSATVPRNSRLTVTWTTDRVVLGGEFRVWVGSTAAGWYIGKVVALGATTSYETSVTLSMPAGGPYTVRVGYRPVTGSGNWGWYAYSPGSVTVTAPPVITVTSQATPATLPKGSRLTFTWRTDHVVLGGEFRVWVGSAAAGWYIGKVVPRNATTSYETSTTLGVPAGGPYSVRVGYRTVAGSGNWGRYAYSTGTLTVTTTVPAGVVLWVDPVAGSDAAAGTSRATALRTLTAAWDKVPKGAALAAPYTIKLVPGTYPEDVVPGWMDDRHGTASAALVLTAADGPGTVTLPALNIHDCSYLQLAGLTVESGGTPESGGGNTLHFEACDHVLIDRCTVRGLGDREAYTTPQETVKANQCSYLTIQDSDISGAWNPAVDFVAVQYGSIVRNKIHRAGDWGIYLKGGSAYFTIAGNEIYDCLNGGFTAGQGTGFEYMVSPWIHDETTDIKFVNNVVHDTEGAGMGVNGSYNVLLAWNTLYRVGRRSHAIELVQGSRSCGGDTARCSALLAEGGWGTATPGDPGAQPVPNRNVFVFDNLLYNPAGYQSEWTHFALPGPLLTTPGSNIPSPALADDNVVIRGNLIWNGPADLPLGIGGDGEGGQPGNPTCTAALVRAQNAVNTVRPVLVDPAAGDFRVAASCDLSGAATVAVPDFAGGDRPARPLAPQGDLSNAVASDASGSPRAAGDPPGAYRLRGPAVRLLDPSQLLYRGAFRLPGPSGGSSWAYSGDGLTYYPAGDPGGAADGFTGSLFGIGHDWQHSVSEVSIPAPAVSATKDAAELPVATTLQQFADVRGSLYPDLGVEMLRADVEYVPSPDRLVLCWGRHFQEGEANRAHMVCGLDLSDPVPAGPWSVGGYEDYITNDYLCSVDPAWAAANAPGMTLATGRFRDGGQGAMGPSLLVVAPPTTGVPPGAVLPAVPLLRYDDVTVANARTLQDYHHSDEWTGAAWLSSGGRSAVVFAGTKGTGDCWYGFSDGTRWPEGPPYPTVPPEWERGWWSTGFTAELLFYDPADLADVAAGRLAADQPQPYAVLPVDSLLYGLRDGQDTHHVADIAFDRVHGRLFLVEPFATGGDAIVHVWEIG